MSDHARILPIGKSLNQLATQQALNRIHETGQHLPASIVKRKGTIATVKFEVGGGYNLPNVTLPLANSQYAQEPLQTGDKGYVVAGATGIGNVDALGPTAAPGLAKPGNLSALVFHPIGNGTWTPPTDQNAHLTQGPTGTVAQDLNAKTQIKTNPTSGVTLGAGNTAGTSSPSFPHSYGIDPTNGHSVTSTKPWVCNPAISAQSTISALGNITSAQNISAGGLIGSTGGFSGGGLSAVPGSPASLGNGASIAYPLILPSAYSSPASGATVSITATTTIIDPTAALAALTISLPGTPTANEVLFIGVTHAVTALTWSGGTVGANVPASAPSGGVGWTLQYISAPAKWFLI